MLPVSTPPGQPAVEDLGGPTPENYKADDDSAKLKEPSLQLSKTLLIKVQNLLNPCLKVAKEEEEVEGEVVAEEETRPKKK